MGQHTLKYRVPIDFKPEQQPDGKWAIRGVPIFECHTSTDPNYCSKVDPAWMYKCVEDQQALKAKGFLPRLFIGHTDDSGHEKPIIGNLDNYRFDPVDKWLYADYVDIEESDLPMLKRYPGRSVEASKVTPAIRGVALLGATSPYFKLPDVKFAEGEAIARYSLEIPTMPIPATDPKGQESGASGVISAEEKADYAKFCKYWDMRIAEMKSKNDPSSHREPDDDEKPPVDPKEPDKKEPPVAETAKHSDAELTAKYSEIVEQNRAFAAKIVALEEANERSTWRAKYAEARVPAGRINVESKLDLLMKLPTESREAFYKDSLDGIVAPPTKTLDPKETSPAHKPEPGTAEEAAAVKAKYQEWKSKGVVKTYAEAQAKYIRDER